ncbi:universal stress protein [Halosimplex aquaticum]|uniref:Universal stress protein n=1 Tax=Halosimplex aquaticum TaxID=3026162 RepID=A0ABD5XV41_9EURY|nr:universal stress protein [Halosimplex aquaticum]
MYESILVPTDGSETSEFAAAHAVALADAFDATVHVLGVVDVEGEAGPFDAGGIDDEFVDRLESEAETAVESVAETATGRRVETAVVDGDPAETIVNYAAEEGIDLVVMGTHGRTGLDRVVTGSTSAQVVRESTVPVVTVRDVDGTLTTEYDDVLIPTDGSPAAEVAIDHGIAVADAFDATVHAVYVVDTMALAGGADTAVPGGGGGGGAATGDILEPLVSSGEDATERIAERAREEGLDATSEVIEGSPGSSLVDYVDSASIDFVAMGTHGRTGLDRVLLGSTTERLMRHANAPVLSVRTDEDL